MKSEVAMPTSCSYLRTPSGSVDRALGVGPAPRSGQPESEARPSSGGQYSSYRTGRILAERYQLVSLLGIGAMGEVYRAIDIAKQQLCAIKLVFSGAVRCLNAERRFQKEAAVVARLFHPNIVEVREFCVDHDGTHFLVMELLHGQDLYSLISRTGAVPLLRTLEIVRCVGAALQYAHDLGVVHRDVKPNNIFLGQRGDSDGNVTEQIKVLDFGLAKLDEFGGLLSDSDSLGAAFTCPDTPPLTQGLVIGTPAYLAPEATIAGGQFVDHRSDQWSLAVVAYELLTGQLPFQEANPYHLCLQIRHTPHTPVQQLVPTIPGHVEKAINRALSKDREKRFDNIQDFVRALDNLPQRTTSRSVVIAAPSAPIVAVPDSLSQPIVPEATKMPANHRPIPSSRGEQPETMRTVQYSAAELLALTQQSAGPQEAVPTMVEENVSTRRYEVSPVERRITSVPSCGEHASELQRQWFSSETQEHSSPPGLAPAQVLHPGISDLPGVRYSSRTQVWPREDDVTKVPTRLSTITPLKSMINREHRMRHTSWRHLQGAGALVLCCLVLLSAFLLGIYHARTHSADTRQTADSSIPGVQEGAPERR